MKPKAALLRFLALAGSSLLAISYSHAADGTWNIDADGLWSVAGNWTPGIADGSGFTANFTNDITADRTVSLDSDRTLTSVVFGDSATGTAGSWILDNNGVSTNNLILAGTTPGITVNALGTGKTATISAIIQGSAGLVKSGVGTLVLSGVNTYTGTTTVDGGELRWGITNATATSALNINNGGTVNMQTFSDSVGALTIAKGGAITGTTGALTVSSITSNNGGTISGFTTGKVVIGNSSTLTYNDTIAGSTTFSIDRLDIRGTTTFDITRGDDVSGVDFDITGEIFSNGNGRNIIKSGSGVMRLSGNIASGTSGGLGASGTLTIQDGTLIFAKSAAVNAFGGGGLFTIGDGSGSANSAVLRYETSSNQLANNAISINSDGLFDLNGLSETTSSALTMNGGSLTTGGGTLTLSAATNTIGGASTVTGDLTFTGTAATNLTLGGTASINGTTTFSGANNAGITATGTTSIAGTLAFGSSTRIIAVTNASDVLTISALLSGSNSVTKTGDGALTLSNSTSSWSGALTVQTGTLIAGANAPSGSEGAFGSATSDVTLGVAGGNTAASILTGGAFTIGRNIRNATSNSSDTGTRVLTLGGNTADNSVFSGNIYLGTANQTSKGIQLTAAAGGQVTFSGLIQDPTGQDGTEAASAAALNAVTKVGEGTVILSNTNTYTGATTVSAGTLYVTGALSNSAVTVQADGTVGSNGSTGSLGNGLTIETGGNLDLTGTTLGLNSTGILSLTGGTLTLGNLTFEDLVGWNWSSADVGTYQLIDGTFDIIWGSTAFLSEETAYDFGNGKKGYFTSGSLNAVIVAVPEPRAALLGGLGLLVLLRRRRA